MLKDSGLGCYIGIYFMGAVGYADDIAVIAPSVMSLKKMIHICDRFGGFYHVTFNISKYQLIHYSNYRDEYNGFKHNDIFIEKSDFDCHFNNVIEPNPNKLHDLVINKFITSFNWLNVMFRKSL